MNLNFKIIILVIVLVLATGNIPVEVYSVRNGLSNGARVVRREGRLNWLLGEIVQAVNEGNKSKIKEVMKDVYSQDEY